MKLSKNQIKYFNSFQIKKKRELTTLFVAEGEKLVLDLLTTSKCNTIISTQQWFNNHKIENYENVIIVDNDDELHKISALSTAPAVIALFYKPKTIDLEQINWNTELIICTDEVQDPGNLGTIVRLADWFGIKHIICSPTTADIFNTKTIQSTMGAIARVQLHYTPLEPLLHKLKSKNIPIYGTFLEGENIYQTKLSNNGIIVMGNEGKGISKTVEQEVTQKLHIPPYPGYTNTSESLNVAMATGIICAEFRRRIEQ